MKKKNLFALLIPALLLTMVGCDKDKDKDKLLSKLSWDVEGLPSLGSAFQYEGWIIVDGKPVSTGTFTADNSGTLSVTKASAKDNANLTEKQISEATKFVISIEPKPDTDPAPAKTKILSGTFSNNKALLTTAPIGKKFEDATGEYDVIVATEAPNASEEPKSGIWFVKTKMHSEAGLSLPTLEKGWKYEGWVVIKSKPVSTGTFKDATKKDDSALFSGTGGPNFPGEDFLKNAPEGLTFPVDIRGSTVVVSIEPDPDDSTAPFALKPLIHTIPNPIPTTDGALNMVNKVADFPTGTVTRKE